MLLRDFYVNPFSKLRSAKIKQFWNFNLERVEADTWKINKPPYFFYPAVSNNINPKRACDQNSVVSPTFFNGFNGFQQLLIYSKNFNTMYQNMYENYYFVNCLETGNKSLLLVKLLVKIVIIKTSSIFKGDFYKTLRLLLRDRYWSIVLATCFASRA